MTHSVWLPEHGALLKKLREDAGVEITTLARTHSLSTSHIKQLEEGGDSAFYTASIKLATGRKLLMHFGADVETIATTQEVTASHTGEVAEVVSRTDVKEIAPDRNFDVLQSKSSLRNLRLLLSGAALLFLGFAFSNVYLSKKDVDLKVLQSTDNQTPSTLSKLSTLSKTSSTLAQVESKPVEVLAAPISSAVAQTVQDESPQCKWSEDSPNLSGHQPNKIGDYVHLVARVEGAICVKDATGKVQVLSLKTSQSQTVRGRQPFQIYSLNLAQFQIFYQGNLLRLPNEKIQNITLKEQKIE